MAGPTLGRQLAGSVGVAGTDARLYERGIAFDAPDGEVKVHFDLPSLGRPLIGTGTGSVQLNGPLSVWSAGSFAQAEPLVREALAERLVLRPVGETSGTVPLMVADAATVPHEGGTHTLDLIASSGLVDRQLYDVVVEVGDQTGPRVVAPHALYFRENWTNFGLAHITDMHVARRIDSFRQLLRDAGLHDAADRMVNWNDRFRGFIRYANYLHGIGKLDLIIATGDLYDYKYETDDDPAGGGNAEFLAQLVNGEAPGPDFPDVEALRVPLCVVPGNHDYRNNPYRLILDWNAGLPWGRLRNYSGYHILEDAAAELANRLEGSSGTDVPYVDADVAADMVAINQDDAAYVQHLGYMGSYTLELGPHRIVMLDTEWDQGVANDPLEALRATLGLWTSEDEVTFVGGSPNSHGISADELAMATEALNTAPANGLVILGMHAPLFNMPGNTYPYFLRETQRPAQNHQPADWMKHHDIEDTTTWFPDSHDHRDTKWVKRGSSLDGLDMGVSRGEAEPLLHRIVGDGAARRADVVLAGHTHRHNEFRIDVANGELFFYLDFYTENPSSYYPTRFNLGFSDPSDDTSVTYVDVLPGVDPSLHPWAAPEARKWPHVVHVPTYATPLNSAADKKGWWDEHRPLVLQTGALGPMEDSQVSFSGFRVLTIADDTIQAVNFISIDRLEDNGFALSWEDATRVDPPPGPSFVGRTEQYRVYPSQSASAAAVMATNGVHDLIFRGEQGRIVELWRDEQGKTGTGDLTASAGAPQAADGSDPDLYVDTTTGTWHLPYRSADNAVRCLYWTTGQVGHDNLSGVAGAPDAAGNPVGFYRPDRTLHHVIYRSGDGHLQALYWSGAAAAQYEDLTAGAGLPAAVGDPSPYFGGGYNIVAYRGQDGHVHTVYWSDGPSGHDDLSGVAGTPNAAGDPIAYYTEILDTHQVAYRGEDGHLYELWWVGANPVAGWNVTAAAGAPAAASDPAAFYNHATKTKHVVYRTTQNAIVQVSWRPGGSPTWVDLTGTHGAPAATLKPTALLVGATNTEHVVYRGFNGHIYEFVSTYPDGPGGGPTVTDIGVVIGQPTQP